MKLLFPVNEIEATLNSPLSRVFGNAKSFLIVDTNTDEKQVIENSFYGAKEIHIAKDLKEIGIEHIVTEKLCAVCFKNVSEAGIDVYQDDGSIDVREAYNKMRICGLFPMQGSKLKMHTADQINTVDRTKPVHEKKVKL